MSGGTGQRVIIVGAGLAGSLLACQLGRRGYRVSVFEKRADPRSAGFVGGRSINLALSERGITALRTVGLAEAVLRDAVPMRGRKMHSRTGELTFHPYSADESNAINSVSRGGLNLTLLNAADEHEGVELRFEHRCVGVDFERAAATFERPDGSRVTSEADVVIGADGAFSAVRLAMQMRDGFTYSQEYLEYGYKELHIPPAAELPRPPDPRLGGRDGYAMEPNALHIWPRGSSMMIALPNADRSFTCTLFWPHEGEHGFAAIDADDDVSILRFFERHYPDATGLMPTLCEDYRKNPTSSLVTIRCWPWQVGGRVLLIGDAAHAVVPFYGQGMNAAFEDCRVLCEMLDEAGGDAARVLPAFERARKAHAEAIADMALENFVEMRDKVASRAFLVQKRVEQEMHRLLPGWWKPRYDMVSFSNIPYAEARRRAEAQWGWVWAIGATVAMLVIAGAGAIVGWRAPAWLIVVPVWVAVVWLKGPWGRSRRRGRL